jgi:hypothetical protein
MPPLAPPVWVVTPKQLIISAFAPLRTSSMPTASVFLAPPDARSAHPAPLAPPALHLSCYKGQHVRLAAPTDILLLEQSVWLVHPDVCNAPKISFATTVLTDSTNIMGNATVYVLPEQSVIVLLATGCVTLATHPAKLALTIPVTVPVVKLVKDICKLQQLISLAFKFAMMEPILSMEYVKFVTSSVRLVWVLLLTAFPVRLDNFSMRVDAGHPVPLFYYRVPLAAMVLRIAA